MKHTNLKLQDFPSYTRKAATEGIVLLQNENSVLPLKNTDNVSLFGRCQIDYYKHGTGSGGAVNAFYAVSALEGFRNNNRVTLNEDLASIYETFVKENPFDNGGGGWAMEPWSQIEMSLTDKIVEEAALVSNKAIVFIGRTAGEAQDNSATKGSYYLNDLELEMILKVTSKFDDVVLVMNVSNIVDMSFLESAELKGKISSVLYSWQGGMEGGNALVDVLCGDVSPSGRLSGTIAWDINTYPSFANFDNMKKNYYEEDIYVGYRYFETFNKSLVQYPFGYGLSYSSFDINVVDVVNTAFEIKFKVDVKNTGNYKSKEVIQIYVEAPQGELGKPYLELVGFTKSKELDLDEEETLEINIPIERLASYDDGGYTGYKSSYVIEAGDYNFYVGKNVRDNQLEFSLNFEELIVIESLSEALAPKEEITRIKPGIRMENGEYQITNEIAPMTTINLDARINDNLPSDIKITGNMNISLQDVKNSKNKIEEFVAQLELNELATILRGEGMGNHLVTPGTAAAFGGLSAELRAYGIPAACAADGPSGIRMDTGQKATLMPIGTLLACTWNTKLMEELYYLEGLELVKNEVDTLLGPGMNIHRHPLNGRNFEYFSEDPLLTGEFTKAATLGMHKGGASGTIKHFAANDQEKERLHVDSVVSERALREIHLKPFEIAVKEGNALSIMTSYNPINGVQTASNYDLNTTILRGEWGYTGMVMTDWWAIMNNPVTMGDSKRQHASYMVKSQNDLYMVVNNHEAKSNVLGDDLEDSVKNGTLTIGEMQRSVINILNFILQSPVIEREIKADNVIKISGKATDPSIELIVNDKLEIKMDSTVNKTTSFNVSNKGIYSMYVEMNYTNTKLGQSACNILLNSEFIYNAQSSDTSGKWIRHFALNLELETGLYDLELDFRRPGMTVGTILIIKN